jgi:hypothetical protein
MPSGTAFQERVEIDGRAILFYAQIDGRRTLVNVLGCLHPAEEALLKEQEQQLYGEKAR